MENQEKGLLYEKQVKSFIINNTNNNAYLWNECPENILIENKLISSHNHNRLIRKDIKEGLLHNHKDIGIDIIQINDDNSCSAIIQCKNGYNNGICIQDIAGIMFRCALNKTLTTCIYYTNSLSRNIKYVNNLSSSVISIDYSSNDLNQFNEIEYDKSNIYFIKLPFINNNDNHDKQKKISNIIPYDYQLEAVEKLNENFNENNRGILSIPCGCGKTYISFLLSNNYNHIIIISPLREFALQNLNRFIEYGYDKSNSILIDCDGIRDNSIIETKIKTNEKLLISATFKSMDIIANHLHLFKKPLFIIDEFHNLSKSNISNNNDNIYKLLISEHKILFMSATPRIYDIEELDDNSDDENDYESNFNDLFGNVVYNINFTTAISNKYITDYNVYLPAVSETNDELNNEISIYKLDNQLRNRCVFLYSCIINKGSRKVIIYCKDTDDMNKMIDTIKTLNDFYILDIDINSISCENTEKERKQILKEFANNNDKIQLLFNIRILNECIDIPTCDSIYISYAPKNKITTIQRINRATRIDKQNPFKIANIYIWCDQYEEILETLSSIKEYDETFKDKIKINVNNFYNNQTEKELKLIKNDIETIEKYKIGIKEFKILTWDEKLELIEDYIKENNKLPSKENKNKEIKSLGEWIQSQKKNYKNNEGLIKNNDIKLKWEEFTDKYKDLFKPHQEIWKDNLINLENYIKENGKLPSSKDKNKQIKQIFEWLSHQKINYKNNEGIMKNNKDIKIQWEEFVNKYKDLFKSNEEYWEDNLIKLEDYIKENNKLPSSIDKNKDIKYLGRWIGTQKKNYKNNLNIMRINNDIKIQWEEFMNKYKDLFQ